MPNWRNWSSFLWSITLGFVSWMTLSCLWAYSAPNGVLDHTIGALFSPVMGAGYRIFGIMFPDWASPHSGLVYLATLFAALSNFLVITVLCYFCVRAARSFRPEWAPAVESPASAPVADDWGNGDNDHEPVFIPSRGIHITPNLDYEKFNWRSWKLFRKHRGRWPVLSIGFHYFSLAGMVVNAFMFFRLRDQYDWSISRSWIVGGVLAIVWCGFFVGGQKLMWKLDWRRSGRD